MKIVRDRLNEIRRDFGSALSNINAGVRVLIDKWCEDNYISTYTLDKNLKINTSDIYFSKATLVKKPDYIKFGTVLTFSCADCDCDDIRSLLPDKVLNELKCYGNPDVLTLDQIKETCEITDYTRVYCISDKVDSNKKLRMKNRLSTESIINGIDYNLDGSISIIRFVQHYILYRALTYMYDKYPDPVKSFDVIEHVQSIATPNSVPNGRNGYWYRAFDKHFDGPMVHFTDKVGVALYVINDSGIEFIKNNDKKFSKFKNKF